MVGLLLESIGEYFLSLAGITTYVLYNLDGHLVVVPWGCVVCLVSAPKGCGPKE